MRLCTFTRDAPRLMTRAVVKAMVFTGRAVAEAMGKGVTGEAEQGEAYATAAAAGAEAEKQNNTIERKKMTGLRENTGVNIHNVGCI
jgi:hypothetical protein